MAHALESIGDRPVWVVDDSATGLAPGALPPEVQVLRSTGEEGFARACNRGLAAVQRAGLPLALLLNDDAAPQGDCIDSLLKALEEHPGAAAVGPVLLDERGQVESAGIRVHRRSARIHQLRGIPDQAQAVDALSGACLLLGSHQRLDERYRFGFEDIELCLRLRHQGRVVVLEPRARCTHQGGASLSRRSREATRHALAGHLLLVRDRPWLRPLALGWAVAQVIRERGPTERLAGLREAWRDSRGF